MSTKTKTTRLRNDETHLSAVCDATITVKAAKDGEQAENPKVTMMGYGGGKMVVGYWGMIAINLSKLRAPADGVMPILFDHDTWDLDTVLGQTSAIKNDGKSLGIEGEIMDVGETSAKVLALAKKGFKFQASVGVTPEKVIVIKEDEEIEVNGQMLTGPFKLIDEGELYEMSIVPLGADGSTSAQIAASHQKEEGKHIMANKNDDTPQTPEQIRAAAVAEQNRISAIREEAKAFPDVVAKAIEQGWTVEKTQLEVVKAERDALKATVEAGKLQDGRPGVPHIAASGKGVKADQKILACAASMGAGLDNIEAKFGAETCNMASDLRIRTLTGLVNAGLAAEGKSERVDRHDQGAFIKAAFSTVSIPNVLSSVMHKFAISGYGSVEQVWRMIAQVIPVVDFKTVNGVSLTAAGLLKSLAKDGEIEHMALGDATRTVKADTKARMVTITRQDIVNDDLRVLAEMPKKFGFMAARTFNTDFWAALVAAVANFSAGNGNTTTGALSLTSLKAADALFGALKDGDGNPIGVDASRLVVSTANRATALEIFKSTNLVGGSSKDVATNIFAGKFEPVVTSYLTGVPWYIACDPNAIALMQACFLNGNEAPVIETAQADFNTLGISMRCYYDYGVAFGDPKAAVRSTGV